MAKVECPNCLGTGETVKGNRVKICTPCEGKGEMEEELAEDYIHKWREDLLIEDNYEDQQNL